MFTLETHQKEQLIQKIMFVVIWKLISRILVSRYVCTLDFQSGIWFFLFTCSGWSDVEWWLQSVHCWRSKYLDWKWRQISSLFWWLGPTNIWKQNCCLSRKTSFHTCIKKLITICSNEIERFCTKLKMQETWFSQKNQIWVNKCIFSKKCYFCSSNVLCHICESRALRRF